MSGSCRAAISSSREAPPKGPEANCQEQRSPVLTVGRLGPRSRTSPTFVAYKWRAAALMKSAPGAEIVQQDPARDAGLLLHLERGGCRVAALDQDRNRGVKQLLFRGLTTLTLTDPDGRGRGRTPCSQGELLKLCGKLTHYRKQR